METRDDPATGVPVIARVSGDRLHPTNFGRLCTKGATHAELMRADEGRLTTALMRQSRDGEPARRSRRRRRGRGGPPAARDHRRARARRRRAVRLGADVDRGAVSGQQAGQGLHAHRPHRVQLAAVHGQRRNRVSSSRSARTGRPGPTTTSTTPTCSSSSARTWPTAIRSCSCGWPTASRPGAKLIVVDPRRTATADKADLFLPIRPGTDLALLNGMLHLLVAERRHRRGVHRRAHRGLGRDARVPRRLPARRVAGITGIWPRPTSAPPQR